MTQNDFDRIIDFVRSIIPKDTYDMTMIGSLFNILSEHYPNLYKQNIKDRKSRKDKIK